MAVHDLTDSTANLINKLFVLLFVCIAGALTGALSGYLTGFLFNDTILHVIGALAPSLIGTALWQIGATLGFVGAFFKTKF